MATTMTPVKYVANGDAIKAIRHAMGYNTSQLAVKVGVSPGYMSRIESGARDASPRVLRLIADVLLVPVAALMKVKPQEDTA